MGLQLLDRGVRRPVRELPLRQSFVAHPKTLTVIRQNFHRRTPPIAEDEEPATEWIDLKLRPADPCQAINAGAKVDARHRHQNAHLRGELDHGNADQPDRHNCSTISVAAPGAISSCSLCPFAFCNDSRQPLGLTGNAPLNSMNFIGSGFGGRLALPGTRPITPLIPLSLLYSRPSARAVTYTPCRRATRPAADHTAAENATPRAWLPRHSSNRCRIRTKSRGCPAAPLARLAISCSHHRQSVWAPHYQPEPTSVTHAHRKDTEDLLAGTAPGPRPCEAGVEGLKRFGGRQQALAPALPPAQLQRGALDPHHGPTFMRGQQRAVYPPAIARPTLTAAVGPI